MKKNARLRALALLGAVLMLLGVASSFVGCDLLLTPFGSESGSVTEAPTEEPTEAETPEETEPPIVATRGLSLSHYFGGEAQVGVYTGNSERVVIPPVWEGMPVTVIAYGAFSRDALSSHTRVNDKITEVTLPDTLVHIEKHAFLRCHKLKSIHIPASVTDIDPTAFQECTGLESITVAEGNPVYHAAGNCLIETATGTVIAGCAASVIPDDGSVKAIGFAAFSGCTTLTEIRIPASVTELPRGAFEDCTALVRVEGGEGLVTIGEEAFRGCTALTGFTFSETVKVIETNAFYNCDALTEIVLPRRLEYLGSYAFFDCWGLTRMELPDSVKDLCMGALSATSLPSVTVPEGYTNLNGMLESSRLMTHVYLPSTLTKINDSEFSFCYELTDIHFNGTLEQWLAIVEKDQLWMGFVEEWTVHCTDGVTNWRYIRGSGMKQVS